MRRWGPIVAIAWVLVAAAVTLVGVARNRAGEPESEVALTERELALPVWLPEENTGMSLGLGWSGPTVLSREERSWLDRPKLESLGFDCRYPVEAPSAPEHYSRMLARDAYLVLEYDGDAARRWIAAKEEEADEALHRAALGADPAVREKGETGARENLERAKISATRLFVVDAGLDRAELRRRYPDRSRYVLAKGTVSLHAEPPGGDKLSKPARLTGWVHPLVATIHVPRDQRSLLDVLVARDRKERALGKPEPERLREGLRMQPGGKPRPPRYRVHVRWGRRLEPWVVAVEPM